MSARLAPCLVVLRHEVDRRWPHRDKSSDGWLGDAAHAARESDHNPDENGLVHAIDITTSNLRIRRVVKRAAIGDPRVWYVIANGSIYSKTHNWKKRKYTGANKHDKHIHVSADYNKADENNQATWRIETIFSRLLRKIIK